MARRTSGDIGMVRRAPRSAAAPQDVIGDIARRRQQMPNFNMEVGTPPELDEPEMDFQGMNLGDLIDLNPSSFAQEPAIPGGTDPFYRNLLGSKGGIDQGVATRVVTYLDEILERDKQARENQDKIIARGIQETGYDRNEDARSSPFPGASAVVHPLFAQAATDFSSRAMKQIFPSKGPVKTSVEGKQDEASVKRANKVRRFLNWLLTVRCRSYRGETDKLLMMLPFTGDAIKKLYWDETDAGFGRPKPEFVLPDKFIVPYAATDLEETPRYAHDLDLWPERVQELMDHGVYSKVELKKGRTARKSQQKERADRVVGQEDTANLNDDVMMFREAHVDWYFPELQQENEQAKITAAKKPPAPPPQQQIGVPPAAPPTGPEVGPQGLDMVDLASNPDLGGALDAARTPQQGVPRPETDPDAAPIAELMPNQPTGERRVDDPDSGGFPSGPKLPYIITYHFDTKTPVAIRRNWKKSDANQKKRVWFSHYIMFPWRSFNGLGLWHLIGGLAKSATGSLRALMDSAVIDNMPGGVRLANSRVSGDDLTYRPMEFAKIQAPGVQDIRAVMLPYPKNPTSPVLFELLNAIVGWGQGFAATATQELINNIGANTPATAILQVLEQTAAIYSAVHARLHAAQEREFELLAELTAENLPDEGFAFSDAEGEEVVHADDFKNVKITPVSDPDTFSEFQRSMRGQATVDLAAKAREMGVSVDARYAFTFYAETLNLPDVDKLFPEPQKAVPRDPLSELFCLMRGQPVDAFPGQNHKAHVAFMHAAAMNPTYQQSIQMVAPAFLALAHSHTLFMLRDEIEQRIGSPLPLNAPLPPDQQNAMAEIVAEMMASITEDVLTNGPDPLLASAMLPGAGGAAGAGDPALARMAAAEEKKVDVLRDKHIMDDKQKDNEHVRKMAEKQADIEHTEKLALFEDEMADRRQRREIAAKLLIHFTSLEQAAQISMAERAQAIIAETNRVLDKIFGDINDKAHKAAEGHRGRIHDMIKLGATHAHARNEAESGRAHEREMAARRVDQPTQV